MDTDTVFLTPVESIWGYFNKFNGSQMAALAPEHEDPNIGWYNRFAKHPYYGSLGNVAITHFFWVGYCKVTLCRCKLRCNVNESHKNEGIQVD